MFDNRMSSNILASYLQAQQPSVALFRRFQAHTRMKIFLKDPSTSNQEAVSYINSLPAAKHKPRYGAWIPSDEHSIKELFDTTARCAILTSPFKTVKVKPLKGRVASLDLPPDSPVNISKIPDEVMFSAVLDAVRRPPCIVTAAARYVKSVFKGKPFVALHWRYDKNDWLKWHCFANYQATYATACKHLPYITPLDVARAMQKKLFLWNVREPLGQFLYAASPPSLQNFTSQVYQLFAKDTLVDKRVTLEAFLERHYDGCWKQSDENIRFDEIISMTEMEILTKSAWFFYSSGSTWSGNIRPLRKKGRIGESANVYQEANIFPLACEEMLERRRTEVATQPMLYIDKFQNNVTQGETSEDSFKQMQADVTQQPEVEVSQ